jgi:FkbM family methyltransferase
MINEFQKKLKKSYSAYLNASENVDRDMIKDCIVHYIKPEVDYQDKICLDLGGNVGGFTKIAIDGGAKAVYTVECDIRNYEKMVYSFRNEPKANIMHAAVSNQTSPTIKIYKGKSNQAHCSVSTLKRSQFTDYDEVTNVHISELLDKYKPNIIKIDIEGAEYDILPTIEAYYPDFIFVELHLGKVKGFAQHAIERLTEIYPNHSINPFTVYNSIGGYDCWFKK